MNIREISTSRLREYENNPRNNDLAVEKVKYSIERFGFLFPVVVDVNYIIVCGHTRVRACRELGIQFVNSKRQHPDQNDRRQKNTGVDQFVGFSLFLHFFHLSFQGICCFSAGWIDFFRYNKIRQTVTMAAENDSATMNINP